MLHDGRILKRNTRIEGDNSSIPSRASTLPFRVSTFPSRVSTLVPTALMRATARCSDSSMRQPGCSILVDRQLRCGPDRSSVLDSKQNLLPRCSLEQFENRWHERCCCYRCDGSVAPSVLPQGYCRVPFHPHTEPLLRVFCAPFLFFFARAPVLLTGSRQLMCRDNPRGRC